LLSFEADVEAKVLEVAAIQENCPSYLVEGVGTSITKFGVLDYVVFLK
jgi:hypothetical protein